LAAIPFHARQRISSSVPPAETDGSYSRNRLAMTAESEYTPVLRAFPSDCQPQRMTFLDSAGGFSGARLWRLQTPRGAACLRRWPMEQQVERLQFIQAVLWHVDQGGFHLASVPWETSERAGYVRHGGVFWELCSWMPCAA